MTAAVTTLVRYPVKGLSGERLASVHLTAGQTLPCDRMYAIENGPGAFDPAAPRHLPKVAFLCQMRDERLATLATHFDDHSHELLIARDGQELVRGKLSSAEGRASIEGFFAHDMAASLRGRPRVVHAEGHSFSDVKEKCVHIINLASLRALEEATGQAIDARRFRANVLIDGLEPWAELTLPGRDIRLGGARLHAFKRTVRCAATNVDPVSGMRAGDLPGALATLLGHRDFGIYATVSEGAEIHTGDSFVVT